MRTKLLSAFFALILVSASATVIIAGMVFGKQIYGLAYAEMEVGLNVAEMLLTRQKRQLEILVVEEAAAQPLFNPSGNRCGLLLRSDMGADFVLEVRNWGASLTRGGRQPATNIGTDANPDAGTDANPGVGTDANPGAGTEAGIYLGAGAGTDAGIYLGAGVGTDAGIYLETGAGTAADIDARRGAGSDAGKPGAHVPSIVPCRIQSLPVELLRESALMELADFVQKEKREASGFYVLSGEILELVGAETSAGKASQKESLYLIAAAPVSGGGALLVGAALDTRRELLEKPLQILKTRHRQWYDASFFLKDVRVATTLKEGSLGTRVDANVLREVLLRGKRYVGSASVIGEEFYTAYMPLGDHAARPVGMIGLGARRQMYVDMRNATTLLFALLIACGMLFGFLTTYLFTNWIIQPVASLAKGMDRVARGDLDHKVRIESADELGRLVKSFNLMVRNIKEREIRLRQISEERLSTMEKQVSIGRLAAGVAHEINNPLTSVLSLSMLMQEAAGPDDAHAEDLAIIVEETTRCRKIVRDLLDFARQAPMETSLVDINSVIQETLALASRYEAMEGIRVSLDLAPLHLQVLGDPKRLQQVFTNLISNAADACSGDGVVKITADEDSSGGYVVVKVTDSGPGIPKEHLDRVFDPFFTTKESGQGTGLGLAVSLGIVREHNGSIDLESREGQGVTVTVLLPRVGE